MKLLAIPNEEKFSSHIVDGYILPLEKYSVSYSVKYDLSEISNFVQGGKKVFVILNKNLFNHEIKNVESILIQLEKIGIDGVFFYDLAILSIVRRLSLHISLIWNQTHMVTNYNTIEYYLSKGVVGAVLSNEITLEEMIEIRKNTNASLFVNVIYRPIMSFSRRNLIHNYCKISGNKGNLSSLKIHEKVSDEDFLVREEKDGTSFFYGKIVNGLTALPEMEKNNFDYGIVDLSNLEIKQSEICLQVVRDLLNHVQDPNISAVSDIIGAYTGFLYRKTIYKVK